MSENSAGHGGPEPAGLAYRIAKGKLHWEPVPSGMRAADDALRALRQRPGPPPARLLAAAQWLRSRLELGPAYVGNPRNVAPGSLRWEAKKAGWSWCTVRRAFRDIGAVAEKCPDTGRSRWRARR